MSHKVPADRGIGAANSSDSSKPRFPLTYAYTRVEQAPPLHRKLARYAVGDVPLEHMSYALGIELWRVEKVLNHRPIAEHVEAEKAMVMVESKETLDLMTKARNQVLNLIAKRIESGKISDSMMMRAAVFLTDRHPDGKFVKRTKTETTNTHLIAEGELQVRLREHAAKLGIRSAQDVEVLAAQAGEPSVSAIVVGAAPCVN